MTNIFLSFLFLFIAKFFNFCGQIIKFYSLIISTKYFFDSLFATLNPELYWPARILAKLSAPYLTLFKNFIPDMSNFPAVKLFPIVYIPYFFKEFIVLLILNKLIPHILKYCQNYFVLKSYKYFLLYNFSIYA